MFGKICLKAVRDFLEFFLEYFVRVFFPIWGLKSREGWSEAWRKVGGINFLVGSDIQQKGEAQTIGHKWRESYPDPA